VNVPAGLLDADRETEAIAGLVGSDEYLRMIVGGDGRFVLHGPDDLCRVNPDPIGADRELRAGGGQTSGANRQTKDDCRGREERPCCRN
jgi:hypothetical protein